MAKVGLLSDSHGQADTTARAVGLLLDAGVEVLIHLGDIETIEVLDALMACPPASNRILPVHAVLGNADLDASELTRYARLMGVAVHEPAGRLGFAGRTLAFTHGHLAAAMDRAIAEEVAWLCHGHTHRRRDERSGRTRIINPGALHRAAAYSAAVLDTAADSVRFLEVPRT